MRRPARLSLEELAPWLWIVPPREDRSQEPEKIDWQELFNNAQPIEIEVGFGKGLFLLNEALSHPGKNYFGIEIERKYYLYTANRIAKRELTNVRLAEGDARQVLSDYVADASVDAVHVYFPDPWWKKRHHKRRVFTESFVARCEQILKAGGLFHVATDVEEYFEVIQELLRSRAALTEMPPPGENEPEHDMDYLTNFERKARQQGKPIYRALYQRRDESTPSL